MFCYCHLKCMPVQKYYDDLRTFTINYGQFTLLPSHSLLGLCIIIIWHTFLNNHPFLSVCIIVSFIFTTICDIYHVLRLLSITRHVPLGCHCDQFVPEIDRLLFSNIHRSTSAVTLRRGLLVSHVHCDHSGHVLQHNHLQCNLIRFLN